MKIALLGPIAWRTPPRHYGPWELITGLIADGLARRGIDVTLFATLDSQTLAKLDGVAPTPYAETPGVDGRIWEAMHVGRALSRSGEFDLVHNHLDWLPLAFSELCAAPMVTTIHGFSDPAILPAYHASSSAFVSISDSDRVDGLDYAATVYHGVDVDGLPFDPAGGDDLVILGRIHPDKGTADAIEIARRAGRRLVIAGIVQDGEYFRDQIEPHVDGDRVSYVGSVGPVERARLLGSSHALLHPIAFAEPFGLSVVESMVTGTPVVAYRKGSMPEVVDDGVTGFLVDGVASAVDAVSAVDDLDRSGVRGVAERRFGAERMVDDYVEVYVRLLERDQ